MKFPYLLLPGKALAPFVPIGVVSNTLGPFKIPCLVDSGADVNFMATAFADVFGITDISSGKEIEITGVTKNTMVAYGHPLKFTVGGWKHKEIFFFANVGQDIGILGRAFFHNYKIYFNERKQVVEFKEYK